MREKQRKRGKVSAHSAKAVATKPRDRIYFILLAVFFFSGLCGLMYEVIWTRLLTLVFGSTTYAVSTVLAAFMLGLALGSYVMGKSIQRVTRHQRFYGLIEIAIGVYAFLFIPILSLIQNIHAFAFPHIYNNPLTLNAFRILLSGAAILLPTMLMGATVPLVGHILTRSVGSIGTDIGLLYSLNTLGAALGSFISAFFLIPALGLHWTFYVGGVLNCVVGVVAISWAPPGVFVSAGDQHDRKIGSVPATDFRPALALIAFGLTGFLSMTYENAWSRALIMVFGTSIYAFATMLTTYLFGLGVGSLASCRLVDRIRRPFLMYAVFTAAVGISVFITTPIIGRLPDYFLQTFSSADASWRQVTLTEFLVCFLIMLVPAVASGASFPLVSRLFAQQRRFQIGRTVADVYTVNTAGCILGSLATGFLLIPTLGVERSLLLAGAISILIGAVLLSASFAKAGGYWRIAIPVSLMAVALVGYVKLPSWNQKVMGSGVYLYARTMAMTSPEAVEPFLAQFKVLFYREGPSETVSVWEDPNATRFFRVNGKTDGSDGPDNYTQMFLGLLPQLYSPDPKDALVIGLGTGITAGSLLDLPGTSVDVIEISPAVVEASAYFRKANKAVLESPRTHLYILDGRTWLMAMPKQYDIITSEPSHPWQTGNANLFTIDFFESAARRLRRNGVFCQWLPYYGIERNDVRLLLKSFQRVFPHMHVWVANSDALLIGSQEPLVMDYAEINRRLSLQTFRDRLKAIGMNSMEELLSFFYLDSQGVKAYTEGVNGVNSDEYPIVEFSAPKTLLENADPEIFLDFLRRSYRSKLPLANYTPVGEMHRKSIIQRARFYKEWYIPASIIDDMIRDASQYPFE